MTLTLKEMPLTAYLKALDSRYLGKVLELRETIQDWLAYVPQTFPHYTRHTIEHSEAIILQISKMLFKEDDPGQPVISLSAVETYILFASAYLHDAGMVTSDKEKAEILMSKQWREWTSQGGGAKRWLEIQRLRSGNSPEDQTLRYFLADIQTRFLVAEYVRRNHHNRAVDVINHHQGYLGRFAYDDPVLQRTIADVCVSHGLRHYELDDQERYPTRRDIRGDAVNVRLMAILLRLGDLLDMSVDRACPLLLNAACPIPVDSLAHWSQYQRITHRSTSPERIEITAKCTSQEEHRTLQDWCQWIVEETNQARTLMARAWRHSGWQPPEAKMEGGSPTISIHPAENATYFPSKWTFELDPEAVFQRLIVDLYKEETTFIRELLQNALDACRSKMYVDMIKEGMSPPEYPTQVEESYRNHYAIRVSLKKVRVKNEMSGETEQRQVFTIDDRGSGMDKEIIQRYFLQVGRSYYTTDEFRRNVRFVPTSRYGIGFLSVFAVSDQIVIETHKPDSLQGDGPIKLILAGPRNYLLTEKAERDNSGTHIRILLKPKIKKGVLSDLISGWCKRVEFPIIVDDHGTQTTVTAERPDQFTYDEPDLSEEGARLLVRSFPINRSGIEGELYVFAWKDRHGERWDKWEWAQDTYPDLSACATKPNLPSTIVCSHGISVSELSGDRRQPGRARLDYRNNTHKLTLSRRSFRHELGEFGPRDDVITSRWKEILLDHLVSAPLAISESGWEYKQRLAYCFPLDGFWESLPETIRIYINGRRALVSFDELQAAPVITSTSKALTPSQTDVGHKTKEMTRRWDVSTPTIAYEDLGKIFHAFWDRLFLFRRPSFVRWLVSGHLAIDWIKMKEDELPRYMSLLGPLQIVELPRPIQIGLKVHRTFGLSNHLLLNSNHPFVKWLIIARKGCKERRHGLKEDQWDRLISLVEYSLRRKDPDSVKSDSTKLRRYLDSWRKLPGLPKNYYPPEVDPSGDMFALNEEYFD